MKVSKKIQEILHGCVSLQAGTKVTLYFKDEKSADAVADFLLRAGRKPKREYPEPLPGETLEAYRIRIDMPLIGGTPINDFVAELEKDPDMKQRINRARSSQRRSGDA